MKYLSVCLTVCCCRGEKGKIRCIASLTLCLDSYRREGSKIKSATSN